MNYEQYIESTMEWLIGTGIRVIVIIVLMLFALKIAGFTSTRLFMRFKRNKDDEVIKRADTLSHIIRYVLGITILTVGTVMILSEVGIDIGPIIATAGIVGLAVGFGAQNLVQDVIGGFFILLEDQVRVGDVVGISGKSGLVERITLRMIILRDLAGNVHYIRNGQIDIVTNMTKEYSRYVFDIGVAYRENTDEVVAVISAVDEELRADAEFADDILEPIEILGVDKYGDSAVYIKARIKTKPIKQWRIGREFNRRLKLAFDERDIEIPYPHMTVYMGRNKDGSAAPMNVRNL